MSQDNNDTSDVKPVSPIDSTSKPKASPKKATTKPKAIKQKNLLNLNLIIFHYVRKLIKKDLLSEHKNLGDIRELILVGENLRDSTAS